jgi:hypothetical protein
MKTLPTSFSKARKICCEISCGAPRAIQPLEKTGKLFPILGKTCAAALLLFPASAETVGVRPYEMDWAGRTNDDHAPLVDFENLDGWTVTNHAWHAIEADLAPWAGQSVRFKLIADVGPRNNSSGDWACWAQPRIENLRPVLRRQLEATKP